MTGLLCFHSALQGDSEKGTAHPPTLIATIVLLELSQAVPSSFSLLVNPYPHIFFQLSMNGSFMKYNINFN